MNNFATILNTIRRPFQQEIRKGCHDDVVVNGLGNYVWLWVKNGDALALAAAEKDVLSGLANLFENYASASPAERQHTLEEATKHIDAALGQKQQNLTNTAPTSVENRQSHQQPPVQRTRQKKNAQMETLPLFQEPVNRLESAPPKPAATTKRTDQKTPKGTLPLFGSTEEPLSQEENISTEKPAATVPISDIPVSTDLTSLDFLSEPLQYLKGIGPRRSAMLLAELNIRTVGELMAYYPRDYIDRSKTVDIYRAGRTEDDEPETIQGKVVNHTSSPTAKGKRIGKISIYDGTGVALLVNFGRRIGIMKSLLPVDTEVVVSGKFTRRYNEIQATDYEFEIFEEDNLIHTKRIVPKYPLTAKLTAKMLRTWMRTALDEYGQQISEILPFELRKRQGLIDRQLALNEIHFPTSEAHQEAAQKRLAFEEFFLLSAGMEMKKERKTLEAGIAFRIGTDAGESSSSLLRDFLASLPYELTRAQKRVFREIQDDMQRNSIMNRLIQGDVGSGKTVVAAMALLCGIENGYQGALMVPTEILAEQHHYNLSEMLQHLRRDGVPEDEGKINVVLLKSDLPKAEREETLEAIANGTADLIVGTQALIQEGVDFHKLGLVIVDEQHRFGVMQRATLRNKAYAATEAQKHLDAAAPSPDVLVMTATPIPRTLALTLYGDLNVSVIDELPPGRQVIKTHWIREKDREKLYTTVRKEIPTRSPSIYRLSAC